MHKVCKSKNGLPLEGVESASRTLVQSASNELNFCKFTVGTPPPESDKFHVHALDQSDSKLRQLCKVCTLSGYFPISMPVLSRNFPL